MDIGRIGAQGYASHEGDFYHHWQQYTSQHARSYEQYRPAYRYGYDLGLHSYYGAGTWEQIEQEARTLWELRNPGTWEHFKEPIQCAWATAQAVGCAASHTAQGETAMTSSNSHPARTR